MKFTKKYKKTLIKIVTNYHGIPTTPSVITLHLEEKGKLTSTFTGRNNTSTFASSSWNAVTSTVTYIHILRHMDLPWGQIHWWCHLDITKPGILWPPHKPLDGDEHTSLLTPVVS